jgi:hypothetical protein
VKTETKVIGGFKYTMEQIGAETGEQIVLRLSRPLIAFFAKAAAKGLTEASVAELAISGIEPAIQALSGRDLRYVRKKLVEKTVVYLPDGKVVRPWPLAEHYDEHFAGRYTDALAFFRWGVQLNCFFGSALERLDSMVAKRMEQKGKAESPSTSPPAPHGGSTDSSSNSPAAPQ